MESMCCPGFGSCHSTSSQTETGLALEDESIIKSKVECWSLCMVLWNSETLLSALHQSLHQKNMVNCSFYGIILLLLFPLFILFFFVSYSYSFDMRWILFLPCSFMRKLCRLVLLPLGFEVLRRLCWICRRRWNSIVVACTSVVCDVF